MRIQIKIAETSSAVKLKVRSEPDTVKVRPTGEIVYVGESEPYEGEYTVTPTFEKQILQTAKKTMKENVTVNEIQVTVVSNSSGGNTVIIG